MFDEPKSYTDLDRTLDIFVVITGIFTLVTLILLFLSFYPNERMKPLNDVRKDLEDSGADHAVELLDIMVENANEDLIPLTESNPELKGDSYFQGLATANHIAVFLSGMRAMNKIPSEQRGPAMEDVRKIAHSLKLRTRARVA